CAAMLRNTKVNPENCFGAAKDPALLATDLAEYLVRKGRPFRQAHHAVGTLVALGERKGTALDRLTLKELRAADIKFAPDALKLFELKQALDRRNVTGAPGAREVRKQLSR